MLLKHACLLFLTLVMASFLACEGEVENPYDVEITTALSAYDISENQEIHVRLSNHSESTIYYICTCQIYLEELNNDQVGNTWMVHGFEECLAHVPVEPDQEDQFTIDILFLYSEGHLDGALLESTIEYRLRLDLYQDKGFESLLEGSNILSNSFSLIP